MKPSLPMRHAKAPEGKKAHLWFAPNTLEPSRRPVSVKMYLSAMTYWARPRYDRIADSMTPLPAGESCEPEPRLKTFVTSVGKFAALPCTASLSVVCTEKPASASRLPGPTVPWKVTLFSLVSTRPWLE